MRASPVILRERRDRRIWCPPGKMASYYVYLMTNRSGTLYTGVTNDLERRVYEHKQGVVEGFTKGYKLTRLVFYEETRAAPLVILRSGRAGPKNLVPARGTRLPDGHEILRFAQNDNQKTTALASR